MFAEYSVGNYPYCFILHSARQNVAEKTGDRRQETGDRRQLYWSIGVTN
ncbi:MAG: hypothetical protein AB4080_14360 [Trichodesmium sp.]